MLNRTWTFVIGQNINEDFAKKNVASWVTNRNPDIINFLIIAQVKEHGNEIFKYMKLAVHLWRNHFIFHFRLQLSSVHLGETISSF